MAVTNSHQEYYFNQICKSNKTSIKSLVKKRDTIIKTKMESTLPSLYTQTSRNKHEQIRYSSQIDHHKNIFSSVDELTYKDIGF
jgi:hypothetical protein